VPHSGFRRPDDAASLWTVALSLQPGHSGEQLLQADNDQVGIESSSPAGPDRLTICPGTPTTTLLDGTSLTTTALAPIRLSSPILIGPRILAPAPMITRSPMVGWRFPGSVLMPPSVTPW